MGTQGGVNLNRNRILTISVIALLLVFLAVSSASAQLVMVRKRMKVVKIDVPHRKIHVAGVDDPMNTLGYVEVQPETTTTYNGRPFDWRRIKKGWIIFARGGMTWNMHLKADRIKVLDTTPHNN